MLIIFIYDIPSKSCGRGAFQASDSSEENRFMLNKTLVVFSFLAAFSLSGVSFSAAAKTVIVSESADSGPGTFRAAVEKANRDGSVDVIRFRTIKRPVELKAPVVYTGAQGITIEGEGAEITQKGSTHLLVANGGGNLYLENISFTNAGKSGIVVNVPKGDRPREQVVFLRNVVLSRNGWYGLHFDDQRGGDGTGADSSSSLRFLMIDSTVTGNNSDPALSAADKDGIRIDEGGAGGVTVVISGSALNQNSADGIEIDETGHGDVLATVIGSSFNENGAQPQKPSGLEDGLDIDEAGPGDIHLKITKSTINSNMDEGLDLDEAGDGAIHLSAVELEASGNADENVRATQLQRGNVSALMRNVTVTQSRRGDGVKLESFDSGNDRNVTGKIFVTLQNSNILRNGDEDIRLDGAGGELVIHQSSFGTSKLLEGIIITRIP